MFSKKNKLSEEERELIKAEVNESVSKKRIKEETPEIEPMKDIKETIEEVEKVQPTPLVQQYTTNELLTIIANELIQIRGKL